jgi:hypothetical protein
MFKTVCLLFPQALQHPAGLQFFNDCLARLQADPDAMEHPLTMPSPPNLTFEHIVQGLDEMTFVFLF